MEQLLSNLRPLENNRTAVSLCQCGASAAYIEAQAATSNSNFGLMSTAVDQ
jgi:hypothetical protein